MRPFTKDELIDEVRRLMWATADSLERVFVRGGGVALLGLTPMPELHAHDLQPQQLDPHRWGITPVLLDMYEYGLNGVRSLAAQQWIDFASDTEAFLEGLRDSALLSNTGITASMDLSWHVLRLATARWKLDDNDGATDPFDDLRQGVPTHFGVLTLADVALLAGMDEKSVRNAANPKTKNPLKTFSHGSRTYVATADARQWLSGRRGFRPTVNVDPNAVRDLSRQGFSSAADWGEFLRSRRLACGFSHATLATKLALPDCDVNSLAKLEEDGFQFERELLTALAEVLGLNRREFLLASLALQQRQERLALERQLDATDVQLKS